MKKVSSYCHYQCHCQWLSIVFGLYRIRVWIAKHWISSILLMVCLFLPLGITTAQTQARVVPEHSFSVLALPLILYNDDHGFIYGVRGQGTYFQKDHSPYRLQVLGWYMQSSLNFEHYGMSMDSYLLHFRLRLQTQLGERSDPLANYYGYGNKQDIVNIDKVVGTEKSAVAPVGSNLVRDELINLGIRDSQNRYYKYEL